MIDYQINPKYKSLEKAILDIPRRFDLEGEVIDNKRNVIKILEVEGERFNVKSFKTPNVINQFAYARIYDRLGIKEIAFAAIDKYLKMSRDILDKIDVPKERKIDFYETLDAIGNRKK